MTGLTCNCHMIDKTDIEQCVIGDYVLFGPGWRLSHSCRRASMTNYFSSRIALRGISERYSYIIERHKSLGSYLNKL